MVSGRVFRNVYKARATAKNCHPSMAETNTGASGAAITSARTAAVSEVIRSRKAFEYPS
jgi:hypothetical protein